VKCRSGARVRDTVETLGSRQEPGGPTHKSVPLTVPLSAWMYGVQLEVSGRIARSIRRSERGWYEMGFKRSLVRIQSPRPNLSRSAGTIPLRCERVSAVARGPGLLSRPSPSCPAYQVGIHDGMDILLFQVVVSAKGGFHPLRGEHHPILGQEPKRSRGLGRIHPQRLSQFRRGGK
jgi:hypothetical protein